MKIGLGEILVREKGFKDQALVHWESQESGDPEASGECVVGKSG